MDVAREGTFLLDFCFLNSVESLLFSFDCILFPGLLLILAVFALVCENSIEVNLFTFDRSFTPHQIRRKSLRHDIEQSPEYSTQQPRPLSRPLTSPVEFCQNQGMGFFAAFKAAPRPDNSPMIPLPDGTEISQLILARTYKRWEFREEMLRLKLQRLEKATMAGQSRVEGIGPVELRKEVRRCRVEARWIRIKLESALAWEFSKRRGLTSRNEAG